MADKSAWVYVEGSTYFECSLCRETAYYHGGAPFRAVVRLCTDCADALAAVVNERQPDPEIDRLRKMVAKLVDYAWGRSKVGWEDWKEEWPEEAAVVEAMYPDEYGQEAVDDGQE